MRPLKPFIYSCFLLALASLLWIAGVREQDLEMDPDGGLHNGKEELPCLKKNWLKN